MLRAAGHVWEFNIAAPICAWPQRGGLGHEGDPLPMWSISRAFRLAQANETFQVGPGVTGLTEDAWVRLHLSSYWS